LAVFEDLALANFAASSGSCSTFTAISFFSSLYKKGTIKLPSVVIFFLSFK
jgi:hypothetical protein